MIIILLDFKTYVKYFIKDIVLDRKYVIWIEIIMN